MPLRDDLLNPISAEKPTGESLRYDPLFDKIKEARREELDIAQGDWKTAIKTADWTLTIKLTSEALATKTKDIQLAAWLAQAMLRKEGIESFRECLELIRKLMELYWDDIYPEIEDGDLELRKAPLEWLGTESEREPNRPASTAIKRVPITRGGLSWVEFDQTRQVGPEDAADNYEKQQARAAKIEEGKMAPEVFDKDFDATPKDFYVKLEKTFDGTLESLAKLADFCDEKFGDESPSFGDLKSVLTEVRQTVHILLVRKREKEPDPPDTEGADHPAEEGSAASAGAAAQAGTAWAAGGRSFPQGPLAPLPVSMDDAVGRVVASARYMRQQDASSPVPYLMLRALRWGELRKSQGIDPTLLYAPPLEIRQNLRRAMLESNWMEVLETGETAMGMECGRGWLDLQRYTVRASHELGYERVRNGIIGELKNLIEDYPDLLQMTMLDDMPTANAETVEWLHSQVITSSNGTAEDGSPSNSTSPIPAPTPSRSLELAIKAAASGRPEVSVELLVREIAQETSGRARFQRRAHLAGLCQTAGKDEITVTMLTPAVAEMEERRLEEWESREFLLYPLVTYYRSLIKNTAGYDDRDKIYAWICRLDPLEAMKLDK